MLTGENFINDLDELKSFSLSLAQKLLNKQFENMAILMKAEMGAGKTTLTSALAKALGIKSRITSPTFIGMNHYSSDAIDLYHYDCYQVEPGKFDTLEILEEENKKLFVFEWAENLDESFIALLKSRAEVYVLKIAVDNEVRKITVSKL